MPFRKFAIEASIVARDKLHHAIPHLNLSGIERPVRRQMIQKTLPVHYSVNRFSIPAASSRWPTKNWPNNAYIALTSSNRIS